MEDSDGCSIPIWEVGGTCYTVLKYLIQLPVVSWAADFILM